MTHNDFQEVIKIEDPVVLDLGNKGIIKRYMWLDKEPFIVIGA